MPPLYMEGVTAVAFPAEGAEYIVTTDGMEMADSTETFRGGQEPGRELRNAMNCSSILVDQATVPTSK